MYSSVVLHIPRLSVKMFSLIIFVILVRQAIITNAANILVVIGAPSYSHQVPFYPLWKELSLKGHKVTLLTTDPMNEPALTNLTEINLHFAYDVMEEHNFAEIINQNAHNPLTFVPKVAKMFHDIIDQELSHPEVKALIQNREKKFDLMIAEVFFPTMVAFAHRFNCPLIGAISMDAHGVIHEYVGNPNHPVLYPENYMPFMGKLGFFERVLSTVVSFMVNNLLKRQSIANENLTVKKHFGEDYPNLVELIQNMSLLFINGDNVFRKIRPTGPSTIFIGGGDERFKSSPKLSKELQAYLDSAQNGVIYFSLGTNVKSKDIDDENKRIIIETLAELPYKVLWKYEAENLENKPKNVKIMKWIPQENVLRHPNVKLFITQGGLQSIEEAVFGHVPMIGMPFFGDQMGNVKKIVFKGIGLYVDHKTLTKVEFKKAILEVINNPVYKENIKKLAELSQDQPMTGLERAVWWTEYVIRHKGAKHLRSPAIDMPWYQYFLLDVIGFLIVISSLIIFIIIKVFKILFRLIGKLFRTNKIKTN